MKNIPKQTWKILKKKKWYKIEDYKNCSQPNVGKRFNSLKLAFDTISLEVLITVAIGNKHLPK